MSDIDDATGSFLTPFDRLALESLLSKLCDEVLTDEEATALNAALKSDPAARRHYLKYLEVHGALHWNHAAMNGADLRIDLDARGADDAAGPDPMSETMILSALAAAGRARRNGEDDWDALPVAPSYPRREDSADAARQRRRLQILIGGAVAALVFLSVTLVTIHRLGRHDEVASGPNAVAQAKPVPAIFAEIVAAIGAEWEGQATTAPTLTRRPVTLLAGIAKLRFSNGVEMIVQGPAEFQVLSASELQLTRGRISATITPEARGFFVRTPDANVADFGTEFGVRADPVGGTEVQVFQGRVTVGAVAAEVVSSTVQPKAPTMVTAGTAIQVGVGATATESVPAVSSRFIRVAAFDAITRDKHSAYDRWLSHSIELRKDPRLVAYYTFERVETDDPAVLPNLAHAASGRDGRVIGAKWVHGRFPQKQATDFDTPEARVELEIPGNYDRLTLVTWVKLRAWTSSPNTPSSSLLMSNGYGTQDGYVHWQVATSGSSWLSTSRDTQGRQPNLQSSAELAAGTLNQWRQLAVVYDLPSKKVAFYINGTAAGTGAVDVEHKLRIGMAQIGNWGAEVLEPGKLRRLDGAMDELIIFRDALSAADIRALWESGRP